MYLLLSFYPFLLLCNIPSGIKALLSYLIPSPPGLTVSWPTAPSWWHWKWTASGPTGWWTTSSSGSIDTTSTTAHCRDARSRTLQTASWDPSSWSQWWSPCSLPPWWCGGVNAVKGWSRWTMKEGCKEVVEIEWRRWNRRRIWVESARERRTATPCLMT